ncbi:GNAT family N-acetyltransferase [uncultured Alsobacter sp.]|uniref:GNAT family N-acetyltransferase n=1 Tax=uncultured Alsobacter sp. TaxID=1748258 RepID=UPI0025DF7BED|nr:GNAT family N-acetyltransferase [uncultured Alsobacter sp.]
MSPVLSPTDPIAALRALRSPWLSLWERAQGDPFQHPDWILAWWDVFAPGPPVVAAVREGERLMALAPLYRDPASGFVLPMGVGPSDRTDVLVDSGAPEAAARLAAAIAASVGDGDVLWPDVPPGGRLLALAPQPGWSREVLPGSSSAVIDLDRGQEAVPSSRWRKWRMAGHRAARRGGVAVDRAGDAGAAAFADRLIALNAERHDPAAGGVFADPRMADFVRVAIPALARAGLLEGLVLTIDGAVAGVHCGFRAAGRSYAWLGGFDPQFAFESPGTVLMGEAVLRAIARGDLALDLLRGDEPYKAAWGAVERPLLRVAWRRTGDG